MDLPTTKDSQHLAEALSVLEQADKEAATKGMGLSSRWQDTKPVLFRLSTSDGATGAAYLAFNEPLACALTAPSDDLSALDGSSTAGPLRLAFVVLVPAALLDSPVGIALLLVRLRFALTRKDVQDWRTIQATPGKDSKINSKVTKSSELADLLYQCDGLDAAWVIPTPAPLDCENKEGMRTELVSAFHAERKESAHRKFKGFASAYNFQAAWARYVNGLTRG